MGYSHMFYALDVSELQKIYGSKNEKLLSKILAEQAEEIEDNDAFFEDEIADGDLPDTSTAIRQIFDGNPNMDVDGAIYGYALKIICEHLGEMVWGGEHGVADVTDHPYESMLAKSGIPMKLPAPNDFPMIGYLAFDNIDAEIALATGEHANVASDSAQQKSELRSIANSVGLGLRRAQINAEDIKEDIEAYVETLENAKKLGKGVVSFRH